MLHKKQLFNLFCDIAKLNNITWSNPKYSYDASKAAALVIEEALEKLSLSDKLADKLGCTNTPRELARTIVNLASDTTADTIPEVGAFDSSLDTIYIEVGNLHMQGLSPEQMVAGLQIVHNANLQKSGTKDANNKVTKPTDFVGPEPKLQAILDKRSK